MRLVGGPPDPKPLDDADDIRGDVPAAPMPTDHGPGSPEKLSALIERARAGVSLWHADDATEPMAMPRDEEEARNAGGPRRFGRTARVHGQLRRSIG